MKPRNRIFLDEKISIGKIIKIKDKQAHYLINVLRCKINEKICEKLGLEPTMFFYVVKDKNNKLYSIGKLLGNIKQ